jgi:hypothetical protein
MNFEKLSGKYLLLDTNVLIGYTKYQKFFAPLFKELKDASVTFVLSKFVEIEFLRGAQSQEETEALKTFLSKLFGTPEAMFTVTEPILGEAILITNIYNSKLKNHKIEMVDCILAAEMQHYNRATDQLLLLTVNYKDFPPLLFERIGIRTVDADESIINLCFYAFSRAKYKQEKEAFLQS